MKKLAIFVTLIFSASVFADTYYWQGPSVATGQGAMATAAHWSTASTTYSAASVAPGANDIIKRMNVSTNAAVMMDWGASFTAKEFINDSTASRSASYMQLYSSSSASTLTLEKITQACYINSDLAGSSTIIRSVDRSTIYNTKLKVTDSINVTAGALYIGTRQSGRIFLSDVDVKDIIIAGANAAAAPTTILEISTLALNISGDISVSNGSFLIGSEKDNTHVDMTNFVSPNFVMATGKSLNMGSNATLSYSFNKTNAKQLQTGYIDLDKVNAKGTAASNLNLYTSATQGAVAGSAPVKIATLNADVLNASLTIDTVSDVYVGSVTSSAAAEGSTAGGISIASTGKITIVDFTATGIKTFTSNGRDVLFSNALSLGSGTAFNLTGSNSVKFEKDVTTTAAAIYTFNSPTVEFSKNLSLGAGTTSFKLTKHSMEVKGVLTMSTATSVVNFDTDSVTSAKTITIGGLTQANTGSRVTTSYGPGSTKGDTNLIINVAEDEEYISVGRVHDMSNGTTLTGLGTLGGAKLNVTKKGAGAQYLLGNNHLRGTITVEDGTLYLRAEGGGYTDASMKNIYGVSQIALKGGVLSAHGSSKTATIATMTATTLTWSSGSLLVNINGANNDKAILLGANIADPLADGEIVLSKVAGGVYTFIFDDVNLLEDHAYDLFSWDEKHSTNFGENDFDYEFTSGRADLKAVFAMNADGIKVTFTAIPEPATYAAIFGILALGFVAYRRRK